MKVLVADDDRELRELIGFALRQAGYLVVEAVDGPSAVVAHRAERPDLVILDVNMPGFDGFEACRRIRAEGSTPVMMLTVRGSEDDVVHGLDLGADDYLTKPFSPRALLARARALLRRGGGEPQAPSAAGAIALDADMRTARVADGDPVRLTELEFRLLQFLVAHAGKTASADRLVRHVWGSRRVDGRQLLKQLVHRLRVKIERDPANPEHLVTVAGVGYRLAGSCEPSTFLA